MKMCTVPSCDKKHQARGYCQTHYNKLIARAHTKQRNSPIHLEDVEWMAETGEEWGRAAQRLGVKESTLLRYLERARRYDLVRKLQGRLVA